MSKNFCSVFFTECWSCGLTGDMTAAVFLACDCGVKVKGPLEAGPAGAMLGTVGVVGVVDSGCCFLCCSSEVVFCLLTDATEA